ncbi:MAG TPA: tetratricopeptide repeat protein [Bryobacteraceae bacterium]|nr:tetratricopeptide repeat protein [Bryobacteraceae bacterium]
MAALPALLALVASLLQASAPSREERQWLLEAQQRFQNRQWDEARNAALKALEANPKSGDAETVLGLVETMRSRFQEAERHFRNAAALQPANPRVHAYLGSTYLQQQRLPEAGKAFERVLQLDPGNSAAHYNLGLIGLAGGNAAAALAHFDHVRNADAKDIPALIGALECQLLLKRAAEARQSADRLQKLLDARDPRLFQTATLLAVHGEYPSAIPILERIREVLPDSADVHYNLALAYHRSGQHDKAADSLKPLLATRGRAETYSLLASIEESRNHPQEALRAFRRAAELEPGSEEFRFDHATALLRYEYPEAAGVEFERALRDFPNSWKIRLGLGGHYYLQGKYEDASRILLDAVRIEPNAPLAYHLLGLSYESAGSRQPEILRVLERYVDGKPADAWAYYHYGTILYTQSQAQRQDPPERAKMSLRRALELNPDFPEALLQLGTMAESDEESVPFYERAIKLKPDLALAHYRLGLAYQRMGEGEKAKTELALFRKLRAENEEAEKRRVLETLTRQSK